MKLLVTALFLIGLLYTSQATTYYFSNNSGDDARSTAQAQNPLTPWKTINKLNSIQGQLNPGDTIFFKRGETFKGTIKLTRSGSAGSPIVFAAYGIGNKPIITGFTTVSGWVSIGSNRWETTVPDESNVKILL